MSSVLLAASTSSGRASESVQIIIPFPPGSAPDLVGRPVVRAMQSGDQPFAIDNRAGATGTLGARFVGASSPDGLTWLFAPDLLVTVNPALHPGGREFDAEHSLAVVASICLFPAVLVVSPKLGPKTLAEFVAFAQANQVSFASGGIGSVAHLWMEYFGDLAHLKLRHVAYRGGNLAMADLLAGLASCGFLVAANALDGVRKGQLLPLAVSSSERLAVLPDVPTVQECGYPNFEVAMGYFVWLPVQTPADSQDRAGAQVRAALAHPELQRELLDFGAIPLTLSPADSIAWMQTQRVRWTRLIETHAITPG